MISLFVIIVYTPPILHMKLNLLLTLALIGFVSSVSQAQNALPDSRVNLGVGGGMPYGGLGSKVVIGYRNSGLMIGLGYMPGGMLGYEIGGQVAIQSFYFNLGYGLSGTYKVNDEPVESIKCGNFMVGYMVSLDKMKDVFLDIGIGHTVGAPTVQIGPFQEQQGGVTLALGVGFRLAKK
jgi:hypothetical protein